MSILSVGNVELYEALKQGSEKGKITQQLLNEVFDISIRTRIKGSKLFEENIEILKAKVTEYSQQPIESLPFSVYKLYERTGNRKIYGDEYFRRRDRLNTFALMTWLEEKEEYISQLENIIWAICDEYTWSLPAHLWSKSEENSLIPKLQNSVLDDKGMVTRCIIQDREMLDLFACETGFALAEIIYMLEKVIDPIVVYRARKEVYERILNPFMSINYMHKWEDMKNNWATVCGGSVGAIAMYMIQDDRILTPIIKRCMGAVETYFEGFKADGACTEGVSYWTYGFGFFVYFADLLKRRTDGKVDYFKCELVRKIAEFQQKCYLTKDYTVSFADGPRSTSYRLGLTAYLSKVYDEVKVPDLKYFMKIGEDHCHRWCHDLRDFIWGGSLDEVDGQKEESYTYYLEDAQWLIAKSNLMEEIRCFIMKAGHNYELHNHNDVGTFILHIEGETLITDLGAGEYTKEYFSPDRYSILCNCSRSHSVPIIGGAYQVEGEEFRAEGVKLESTNKQEQFSFDMAKAYNNLNLKKLVRTAVFNKVGEVAVEVTDHITFEDSVEDIVERFPSSYPMEKLEEGVIRIIGDKYYADICYDKTVCQGSVVTEIFSNHQAKQESVYFADIAYLPKVKDAVINIQIKVSKK